MTGDEIVALSKKHTITEYAPQDVCSVDEGNRFTLGRILPEFLAVDYSGVREFPIPVVMFMGRHDYTTPSEPTAQWLAQLKAPNKRGVWFERSRIFSVARRRPTSTSTIFSIQRFSSSLASLRFASISCPVSSRPRSRPHGDAAPERSSVRSLLLSFRAKI